MEIIEFQEANTNGNSFITTLQSKASICKANLEL